MSQKRFAQTHSLPFGTMQALMQGVVRKYRPSTLAVFDEVLGRSTWDLYEQADEEPPEPVASPAVVEFLAERVSALEVAVARVLRQRDPGALEALTAGLTNGERAEVESFIHFVLARRRGH